jgi:NAD-dependent deacetylase
MAQAFDAHEAFTRVLQWLTPADRVAVFSGAGLSKASGLPTYRGPGGLWSNEDVARMSHAETWKKQPEAFKAYWRKTRETFLHTMPNAAHTALAELQKRKPGTALITQNVDGLLQKAGASRVYDIHGSLARERCDDCGHVIPAPAPGTPDVGCDVCKAPAFRMRPDVVLFGEFPDMDVFAEAELAAKRAELVLVVGTSAIVHPAAGLLEKAQFRGARIVEINTEATALTERADAVLRGPAEAVLPVLLRGL